MKSAISVAFCLLFAATGAAVAGEGVLGRLFGGGGNTTDVPKSIWQREKDASGTHLQTRLRCPPTAGMFRLTALVASNPFGVDVWCQYDTTTRDRITLYLTQRQGEPLQAHFDGAKSAIAATAPGATLIADSQENFTTDPAWLSATYDEGRSKTGVWVTDHSGWTLKFRATYASEQQQAAFEAMAALAASAADSAGTHLAACATWKEPERNGRWISDERRTIPLVITGTVMAYAPLRGPNAPPFVQPIWCMARALTVGNEPFVLWYNIAQQDGGFVDRVTAMRDNNPLAVLSISDTMGSNRGESPITSVHDIAVETENTISIVGIYDGAPTLDEIAGFATSRPVGLFATIDKKTNKVTVYRAPPQPTPVRSSP